MIGVETIAFTPSFLSTYPSSTSSYLPTPAIPFFLISQYYLVFCHIGINLDSEEIFLFSPCPAELITLPSTRVTASSLIPETCETGTARGKRSLRPSKVTLITCAALHYQTTFIFVNVFISIPSRLSSKLTGSISLCNQPIVLKCPSSFTSPCGKLFKHGVYVSPQ